MTWMRENVMNVNPITLSSIEKEKKGSGYKLLSTIKYGLTKRLFANKLFLAIFIIFTLFPMVAMSIVVYYGSMRYQVFFSLLQTLGDVGMGDVIGDGRLTPQQFLYVGLLYYTIFLSVLGDWTFVTIIFGGVTLVSEEFEAKTFKYYFSRPFPSHLYMGGRFFSLIVAFYPLIAFPFLVGMGIPLVSIPVLGDAFSFINIVMLFSGGLFALFLLLTIQIVMILTLATYLDKKFVILAMMLLYYVSWGVSQYLLPQGDIFALISFNFYLQSVILLFISLIPFGTTITGRMIPTHDPFLIIVGGCVSVLFLGIFICVLLWRLKSFER